MSTLQAPRFEVDLIDPATGKISRIWYRFLAQLAKSVGASSSLDDDVQIRDNSANAAIDAQLLSVAQTAQSANYLLFTQDDQPQVQDLSLLAYWPLDYK